MSSKSSEGVASPSVQQMIFSLHFSELSFPCNDMSASLDGGGVEAAVFLDSGALPESL